MSGSRTPPDRPGDGPFRRPPPGSSGETYSEVLAEVLDRARHATELRSARRPAHEHRKPVNRALFAGLGAAFLFVATWNAWLLLRPVPGLPPREEAVVTGVTLFAVAQRIEGFKTENGRLPEDLDEIGLEDAGLIYTVAGDRYRLDQEGDEEGETGPAAYVHTEDPVAILEDLGVPVTREGGG